MKSIIEMIKVIEGVAEGGYVIPDVKRYVCEGDVPGILQILGVEPSDISWHELDWAAEEINRQLGLFPSGVEFATITLEDREEAKVGVSAEESEGRKPSIDLNTCNVAQMPLDHLRKLAIEGDHMTRAVVAQEICNRWLAGELVATRVEVYAPGILHCWSIEKHDGVGESKHAFYLTEKAEVDKYLADPRRRRDSAVPKMLLIYGTVEQSIMDTPKAAKERALAKLTEAEKSLLGVG